MARGLLIVIEGLDRTGKSTQSSILVNKLKPHAELIKFPDRTTPIGGLINKYLTDNNFTIPDQAVHLLFSANRWELFQYLQDVLLSGKHIVMDRYVYSGIAYSLAKGVSGMDFNWCLQPDRGMIKPDLLFFLYDGDSQEAASRAGFGQERYEKLGFQNKVKEEFYRVLNLLENYSPQGSTSSSSNRLQTLDVAKQSIDQLSEIIDQIVKRKLQDEIPTDFEYF